MVAIRIGELTDCYQSQLEVLRKYGENREQEQNQALFFFQRSYLLLNGEDLVIVSIIQKIWEWVKGCFGGVDRTGSQAISSGLIALYSRKEMPDAIAAIDHLFGQLKPFFSDSERQKFLAEREQWIERSIATYRQLVHGTVDEDKARGYFYLGHCYRHGLGLIQHDDVAAIFYDQAAKLGMDLARCVFGYCLQIGRGIEQDETVAFSYYQKGAEKELPEALNNLGHCYKMGIGCDMDEEKAHHNFLQAAVKDLAEGMYQVACCYQEGSGVPQSRASALEWLQQAADRGMPKAMIDLACELEKEDPERAFSLYQKAADWGNTVGIWHKGRCYDEGIGVPENLKKAAACYCLAAKKGLKEAQHAYGNCLEEGRGVEENLILASEKYQEAALQGDAKAALCLASFYYEGRGLEENRAFARIWCNHAVDLDLEEAKEKCKEWFPEEEDRSVEG